MLSAECDSRNQCRLRGCRNSFNLKIAFDDLELNEFFLNLSHFHNFHFIRALISSSN